MSDTLMTIIGIFLAVILMFVFPLMEIAGKNDEMSQTVAQVAVSDFVNKVASTGKITEFDYNELIQKLYATGNSYDIQIEAKIIDDNPRRATTTTSSGLLGEYKYYSVYTNTILEKIRDNAIKNGEGTGEYVLKKDDYIIVTVKNTNITIGTQLKNLMYKLIGKDTYTIGTSASALVLNSGNDVGKNGTAMTENTPTYPDKNIAVKTYKKVTTTTTLSGNLNVIVILDCEPWTMPYHNNNGTSEEFIQSIINAGSGKCNLAFILTCNPNNVYDNPSYVSWIYDAFKDTTSSNYVKAFNTAFQWLEDKTETRCIVFLSYHPEQNYLNSAINTLKSHPNQYDEFYSTYCCNGSGAGSAEKWHSAIGSEKSGGSLGTGDIGSRFGKLVTKTITVEEKVPQSVTTSDSRDLIVELNDLDTTQEIIVRINNFPYALGSDIPSYVVYYDSKKAKYVLDLKLVIELLDMTLAEWNNASVEIEYTQTS